MNTHHETPYATEGNLLQVVHEARFAGGLAASGQRAGFGGNLFTRDACRMLLDTSDRLPSMAREILGILPQMQGSEVNPATNEFPDAMPHQVFRQITGGRRLPDKQVGTAEYWTEQWGVPMQHNEEDGKWFAVYNSSDGPLLYLLALTNYCNLPGGRAVLNDTFVHRPTGETRTVAQAALRCLNAVMYSLQLAEEQGSGLYVVPNTNPKQTSPSGVMRDGFDSYYHPGGVDYEPIDFSFVAYIDNQALLYEALTRAGTELFPVHEDAVEWLAKAEDVRHEALKAFWMDDAEFFAAAIDRYGEQVRLESTAAAEILNGPFLDLPDGPDFVKAIAKWLYSEDVMTPVGPRMLHKRFDPYEGEYYAYQGCGAVWPVTNGIIARGLRRHGLYALSQDLGVERTLGWLNRSDEAVELGYVDRDTNQPVYNPYPQEVIPPEAKALAAASLGQLDQGWTATAALREIWDQPRSIEQHGTWQRVFGRQVLQLTEAVPPASAGEPEAHLYIDLEAGQRLRGARLRTLIS